MLLALLMQFPAAAALPQVSILVQCHVYLSLSHTYPRIPEQNLAHQLSLWLLQDTIWS